MVLFVCKSFSGEIFRVELTTKGTVLEAMSEIADTIGYESPDYERIGLYNLTQDFEYNRDERFEMTGTNDGDLVIMADGAAGYD